MSKIISLTNQKGGVGKTTSSVNLAASFAVSEVKTLLIDLDPQSNATTGIEDLISEPKGSIYDAIIRGTSTKNVITKTKLDFLDIITSNSDLVGAEVELVGIMAREFQLEKVLKPIIKKYDYILIDCPPSLGLLTLNALTCSNSLIIPIQCEYYALEGLTGLLETIEKIRKHLNPNLKIEGLLRTMYDPRNNLATQVSAQLIDHFGEKVYRTIIPRNVRLAEAPSHGLTALKYDKSSSGAVAYLALAGEILRREGIAA